MTYVGITGHQNIPRVAREYIIQELRTVLVEQAAPLAGLSSLAAGADQLFAVELLSAGGKLHAVIPARRYDETFSSEDRALYRRLLNEAVEVTRLPYEEPGEEAYYAAGKWIAEQCDTLIAIWDGKPSRGLGGTADAVSYAESLGRDIRIIWPEGVDRD